MNRFDVRARTLGTPEASGSSEVKEVCPVLYSAGLHQASEVNGELRGLPPGV